MIVTGDASKRNYASVTEKNERRAIANLHIVVRSGLPDPLLLHHFLTAFIEIKVIQYRCL